MSTDDVRLLSSGTGTFRQLPVLDGNRELGTGKQETTPGNSLPDVNTSEPDIAELAQALNVATQSIGRELRFEVDMNSGRSVIQVLDRDTGEVIRQIPPEKASLYLSETGAVALRLYDELV
ncbi:MAG: flagellar protein FlaG [Gammaproteobacteria bacterium]|nr:flagellar protein FlaG [Gammaproteobacteria bacterium]